jgi:ribosomal protein S12 methylthiotransferase
MESGKFIGRTEFDSPEVDNEVIIESPDRPLRIGDFEPIFIHEATEFDLYGTPAC